MGKSLPSKLLSQCKALTQHFRWRLYSVVLEMFLLPGGVAPPVLNSSWHWNFCWVCKKNFSPNPSRYYWTSSVCMALGWEWVENTERRRKMENLLVRGKSQCHSAHSVFHMFELMTRESVHFDIQKGGSHINLFCGFSGFWFHWRVAWAALVDFISALRKKIHFVSEKTQTLFLRSNC